MIITLLWAEHKARKLGVAPTRSSGPQLSYFARVIAVTERLDVIGLLLIGTSVALFLLPLVVGIMVRILAYDISLLLKISFSINDRYGRCGRCPRPRVRSLGF